MEARCIPRIRFGHAAAEGHTAYGNGLDGFGMHPQHIVVCAIGQYQCALGISSIAIYKHDLCSPK